jgi:type II secretory pathway pseudopilin PulG
MRIHPKLRVADAKEMSRQGELAFTMVEIAIAIGVIGFALVAIIGILPAGLDVQKDNREDTLISQDAPYFLDAIRNGAKLTANLPFGPTTGNSARGLDFLTNYVQSIRYDTISNGVIQPNLTTNFPSFGAGYDIIGLLSAPQYNYANPNFASNYFDITATVRALSGPATEQQTGANTGLSSAMAFTYQMEVMVTPFNSFAYFTTNWSDYLRENANADPNQFAILSNRWWVATSGGAVTTNGFTGYSGGLTYNLFDVRLRFSWPVLANGKVGPGRQTYHTLVASQLQKSGFVWDGAPCWFFQPQAFVTGNNVSPNL